jgi:hypothetical protein
MKGLYFCGWSNLLTNDQTYRNQRNISEMIMQTKKKQVKEIR